MTTTPMKAQPPDPIVHNGLSVEERLEQVLDELKLLAESILALPGLKSVSGVSLEVDLSTLSQLVMRRGELAAQLTGFDTANLPKTVKEALSKKLSQCEALDKEVMAHFEQGKQLLDKQLQECHANRRILDQYKLRLSGQNITQDESA